MFFVFPASHNLEPSFGATAHYFCLMPESVTGSGKRFGNSL
jgi:hypothetical protein